MSFTSLSVEKARGLTDYVASPVGASILQVYCFLLIVNPAGGGLLLVT